MPRESKVVLVAVFCSMFATSSDANEVSLICTSEVSAGISWSPADQRFKTTDLPRSIYRVKSVEPDGSFCSGSNDGQLCLRWSDIDSSANVSHNTACRVINAGHPLNEGLVCAWGVDKLLRIDVKRGTYLLARNGGLPLFGDFWEQMNDEEGDGYSDVSFVEQGFCRDFEEN
jgi:hypothetical protein